MTRIFANLLAFFLHYSVLFVGNQINQRGGSLKNGRINNLADDASPLFLRHETIASQSSSHLRFQSVS